jgi:hypothetical protein
MDDIDFNYKLFDEFDYLEKSGRFEIIESKMRNDCQMWVSLKEILEGDF